MSLRAYSTHREQVWKAWTDPERMKGRLCAQKLHVAGKQDRSPLKAHNIIEFTLEPAGGSTNVTWSMRGAMPYLSKVMSVFFNMDSMVGKDFEAGLAGLKTMAEK